MTGVALVDREPLLTVAAGTRIARRAWADISDLTAVVREAGEVLASARNEAQAVRQQAHAEGYTKGIEQAQVQSARHLLEAQRAARRFVEASEERIVALAVAIVERIAPKLNQAQLLAALAAEALTTIRAERHLRVAVAEEAVAATRAMLEQWQQAHPEIESAQVVANPDLEPFACEVDSELGRIRAGLRTQLAAIGETLTLAARSRS
jgi:type III secretion protein L